MNRDNLFWNKTTRDVLSLAMLSTSWNYGTLRSFAGGVHEGLRSLSRAASDLATPEGPGQDQLRKMFGQGKETMPKPSSALDRQQLAYWMTTAALMGVYGAVKTYMHTGHGPQSLNDYIHPVTGRKDEQGRDVRSNTGSYLGDMYGFLTHPIDTLLGKAGPVPRLLWEATQNKDVEGQKIVNPDDSLRQKAVQTAKYIGRQFTPASVQNMIRLMEQPDFKNESAWNKISNIGQTMYGARPASVQYAESDAEQLARRLTGGGMGQETPEQSAHGQLIAEFADRWRQHDPAVHADISKAIQSGDLKPSDQNEIRQRAKESEGWTRLLQRGLNDDDLMKVWGAMTPQEKIANERIVRRRLARSNLRGQARRDAFNTLEQDMAALSQTHNQPQSQ